MWASDLNCRTMLYIGERETCESCRVSTTWMTDTKTTTCCYLAVQSCRLRCRFSVWSAKLPNKGSILGFAWSLNRFDLIQTRWADVCHCAENITLLNLTCIQLVMTDSDTQHCPLGDRPCIHRTKVNLINKVNREVEDSRLQKRHHMTSRRQGKTKCLKRSHTLICVSSLSWES